MKLRFSDSSLLILFDAGGSSHNPDKASYRSDADGVRHHSCGYLVRPGVGGRWARL